MAKEYLALYSEAFKADVLYLESLGYDMSELTALTDLLINQKVIPKKYKDHALTGNWRGYRDAHIDDDMDWIVVYRYKGRNKIVFERTGSHLEIFGQ
jgi:mRNA interferase YafQ